MEGTSARAWDFGWFVPRGLRTGFGLHLCRSENDASKDIGLHAINEHVAADEVGYSNSQACFLVALTNDSRLAGLARLDRATREPVSERRLSFSHDEYAPVSIEDCCERADASFPHISAYAAFRRL